MSTFIMKSIIWPVFLVLALSILSACGNSSSSSANTEDNEYHEQVALPGLGDLTLVPLKYKRWEESSPLLETLDALRKPVYAFKDKRGNFVRFNNDADYSDLFKSTELLELYFLYTGKHYQNGRPHYPMRVDSIVQSIFDKYGYTDSHLDTARDINDMDCPELRDELKNKYNAQFEEAFYTAVHDVALYFNGYKDRLEPEIVENIDRLVYNNQHPENRVYFKDSYRYNQHSYSSYIENEVKYIGYTESAGKSSNHEYFTLTDLPIPEGSLVLIP